MREEICKIQLSTNDVIFEKAKELYIKKYSKSTEPAIVTFLNYLKKTWFHQTQSGWYEGFLPGKPSTSNSLESFHRHSLKDKDKINSRLPTLQLLNTLIKTIKNWISNVIMFLVLHIVRKM